ncbi:putative DNA helicase ino80 [Clydaea vesicula]|uniref:Chromatin-remodeling ATPase INO80 n=1 Tax=Clydaea vesicula TaxID=447962 RepID=A0AAD5TTS9_9FUNG|nr:putative DNA helicase ino80 [Clydaea vesicula]
MDNSLNYQFYIYNPSRIGNLMFIQELSLISFLNRIEKAYIPAIIASPINVCCRDIRFSKIQQENLFSSELRKLFFFGNSTLINQTITSLITQSGKIQVLEKMLPLLKAENHRILMYFQMTKMIDLMEEYLTFRKYSYLRLDGSVQISDRKDLVMDWQSRPDLFIFLLSTRAGGLGINLTAADTVIFYDSDWNPTVDQQAMDRAHRLGQTKQVTVYRLITAGTIEERIMLRAKQKDQVR